MRKWRSSKKGQALAQSEQKSLGNAHRPVSDSPLLDQPLEAENVSARPADAAAEELRQAVTIPLSTNEEALVGQIRHYFDIKFYLSQNKDVAESGIDPILHY